MRRLLGRCAMTNIKIVDVLHEGQGFTLSRTDLAARVRVVRSRGAFCGLNGCAIPKGAYYLYSRSEGRLCVPCGVLLGALVPVEVPS
jgi:hypothetical protein